ncbi:MAG: glycoside hydrolase family 92 protein, partial [Clostridia bacterium]|nr:glycoside hydrolase family 92 protein [Clostridia bacterium]
ITTSQNSGGDLKNFREYIVIQFPDGSVDADEIRIQSRLSLRKALSGSGADTGIHIAVKIPSAELKIGVSYISFKQALVSLEREAGGKSFDDICRQGEKIWEEYLSRVKIEAKDRKQLRTFYSCMYRAFLYPHKCYETGPDGRDIHYCPHDGGVYEGRRYTDNGFWDTYRTCYSFYSLVARDEMKDMLAAYINEYRESGWLPRWLSIGERGCMPSTLIDAVICDGAVKGLISRGDLETALEGMLKHATENAPDDDFGRNGCEDYCRLGYVPCDKQRESVNLTLDAAYGDWCIAEIASILGKKSIEKEYRKRAKNYKNLFDKKTGFMRPRDSKGKFREDFSPVGWGRDYTEGSAWQNSFAVPHDMKGLAALYGGKEKFLKKIDELFSTAPDYEIKGYDAEIHEITEMAAADFGQCAISNQPSFHLPYIYSEMGETDKTAYWVEKLCNEAFSYEDDGFPGDEDNGSMALWYVFSVLGFYPFCPGKPEFIKGKKQVKRAEILGKEIDVDKIEGNIIPYKDLI